YHLAGEITVISISAPTVAAGGEETAAAEPAAAPATPDANA
ncbi:MAG: hypothetical protein RLZZ501_747, partial [Pseudomonadota bacterium]